MKSLQSLKPAFSLTFLLITLLLPGCGQAPGTVPQPTPVGFVESNEELARKQREAEARTSFNRADLSGCWSHARLRPVYEPGRGEMMLRRTSENQYAVEGGGELTVTGKQVRYNYAGSDPQTGETRFDSWPYQIAFEEVVGLGGLERNQYGWEWVGKNCG